MTRMFKLISLSIAVLLIAGFGLSKPAFADDDDASNKKLVGSWLVYIDGLPEVGPLLYTYNSDGTLIGIAPGNWVSAAHGVWEKVGQRTYDATQISYIFGDNGTAAFLQKANFRIVVSHDGQSCAISVVMDTMLLDGTIVKTITETDTGYRLNVEPFE